MWKGFRKVPGSDPTFWTKPLFWKFMGLGECMNGLGESKTIFMVLGELFIQLDESRT